MIFMNENEFKNETNQEFKEEWIIRLSAENVEAAHKQLTYLADWVFLNVSERSNIRNGESHIICEKIR